MKVTWITALLGSLALIGTPLFSGFYSKDSIIEVVHASQIPGAGYAYFAVIAGVFITAFYSFRMYFLVFHGPERFHHKPFPGEHDHHDDHSGHSAHAPHESPWVVTLPLVLLAVPSVLIGYMTMGPLVAGDFFADAITVDSLRHPALQGFVSGFHGPLAMAVHALVTPAFWLALAGVGAAWVFYILKPHWPALVARRLQPLIVVLENRYYFDAFNEKVLAAGSRLLGTGLWKGGDGAVIDGLLINGSARLVGLVASVTRLVQSGQLYWYALVMIMGVVGFMTWQLWPYIGQNFAGGLLGK